MAAAADTATTQYSAFLSYSHADAAFARRLHRRLESYRLPRRLRRGRAPGGRLEHVFIDRAELTAAPSLSQSVREAIARSGHMIVVCSPSSAASDWVGREIALFRQLHGGANILAALYRGDAEISFHPELLLAAGPGDPKEPPIAADFHKGGDGFRLALLKLVAPLAGVKLDQLIQRDAQRQAQRVIWGAAAAVVGLGLAGVLTVSMLQAQTEAEREHARGGQMINSMIGDQRTRLKPVGRLDELRAVSREAMNFFSGRDTRQLSKDDQTRLAKLLQEMTSDDISRGDFRSADSHVGEAMALTSELLRSEPDNPHYVYDQAQSEFWLGFLRLREGDEAGAVEGMQAYANLAYRLTALEPANLDWRLERAYANSNIATLTLRRTIDTRRAGALFMAAQADFEAVAKTRPRDRELGVQVSDGYAWLAEVARLSGDYASALTYRLRERALIEALVAADHRDLEARGRLVVNDLAVGRITAARGDLQGALASLHKAHDEARAVSDVDPENMDAAQQVRAIELFEARVLLSAAPGQRPPNADIEALIGNCDADKNKPNHEELAQFCTLLRARLLAQEGDLPAAAAQRRIFRSETPSTSNRLSSRWLIDWQSESVVQ